MVMKSDNKFKPQLETKHLAGKKPGARSYESKLKTWRKHHGFKQKELADLLGLKKRVIQYYERGERDGKKITIPKSVRLACHAISNNTYDYNFATDLSDDEEISSDIADTDNTTQESNKD